MKTDKEIHVTLKSNIKELTRIERMTTKIAQNLNLSPDEQDNLSIAITEAVGNAILHGNKKDPRKSVDIIFRLSAKQIRVTVKDQGGGFDPKDLTNPTDPQNILKESGRGIFILKSLMDDVSFSFTAEGTVITFIMNLNK
jgi:serine/threonine-protein kinase RsbW